MTRPELLNLWLTEQAERLSLVKANFAYGDTAKWFCKFSGNDGDAGISLRLHSENGTVLRLQSPEAAST